MVEIITPSVLSTPGLLSSPRLCLGDDSRPGVDSTSGMIISTIILLSSQYLYTMDRNLQRESSSCANGCSLSEEEDRRTIEELVRYILSRFLSVAGQHSLHSLFGRANGGGLDETDGASGILPVKPVTLEPIGHLFRLWK